MSISEDFAYFSDLIWLAKNLQFVVFETTQENWKWALIIQLLNNMIPVRKSCVFWQQLFCEIWFA